MSEPSGLCLCPKEGSLDPLRWRRSVLVRADEKIIVDLLNHRIVSALRCVSEAPECDPVCSLPVWAGTCGPESEDEGGEEKEKHSPCFSIACTAPWALLLLCNLFCVLSQHS